MKRVAILVIAATNQPVYVHYINTHWSRTIAWANANLPHINVFLVFENRADLRNFGHLKANIIRDPCADLGAICEPGHQSLTIPGILSKTVYALELLQNRYDVFFRTNLSSLLKLPAFDEFVQQRNEDCYSSAFVWPDALRQQLQHVAAIGPGKSIVNLSELDGYRGNSFGSGCGYFLSRAEVKSLVDRKSEIRFDIVDDISIGLMFPSCQVLPGFTRTISPKQSISQMVDDILEARSPHIRLEHFPLGTARALWKKIGDREPWK